VDGSRRLRGVCALMSGLPPPRACSPSGPCSGTFPSWLPQAMVDSRAVISLEDNRCVG
jgi:hypothetical protein